MGYQEDTPAAVVFQATNQLCQYVQKRDGGVHSSYLWVEAWERDLPLDELDRDSEQWKKAVSSCEKCVMYCVKGNISGVLCSSLLACKSKNFHPTKFSPP